MPDEPRTNRLSWLEGELDKLRDQNLLRSLKVRESPHVGGKVQIAGRQLVDFGSNDYLSLSADQRLVDAVKAHTGYVGWGSGASPLIHGRGTLHARLEHEIADFEQTQAALTFSSGFAANLGVIPALVGRGDVIFSDEKNHASIIDGCRLSGAEVRVYQHNNPKHLSSLLAENTSSRRRLIVTDSLFSMDGDLAPLPEIVDLADRYAAMVMVDEAHATGVFGDRGTGVCEWFGIKDRVDVRIGTLSKAVGCHGGFVAGSQTLIDWIANRGRSYVFSTAVPDASCMAAVAALDVVRNMSDERSHLLNMAESLRQNLISRGISVGNSKSQIVPVILGKSSNVIRAQERLWQEGFFVPAIRPPSVPPGQARLRISLNAAHDEKVIDQLAQTLDRIIQEL